MTDMKTKLVAPWAVKPTDKIVIPDSHAPHYERARSIIGIDRHRGEAGQCYTFRLEGNEVVTHFGKTRNLRHTLVKVQAQP